MAQRLKKRKVVVETSRLRREFLGPKKRTVSVEEQKEKLSQEGKYVSEFEQIDLVWKDILFCLAKDEPEVMSIVKGV